MCDQASDAQLLATGEFVNECVDALLPHDFAGCSQIDEISIMSDDRFDACRSSGLLPGEYIGLAQRLSPPLPLVFNKNLHAVAARFMGSLERQVQSTRDRDMDAETSLLRQIILCWHPLLTDDFEE